MRTIGCIAQIALLAGSSILGLTGAYGATVPAQHKDVSGAAIADASVPKPPVQPCMVALFANVLFEPHGDPAAMNAEPNQWTFQPPANCPGPWSKVVLEADFAVTAGRQFDRTASIWLDGVNLYFGTTMEPSAHNAPQWHIERDLTQYSSLFRKAGEGQVILNNWVNQVYTGVISGSARLLFYPAIEGAQLTAPADGVYGLDRDPRGIPVPVESASDTLSRALSLPRNVERAYLDVIAQSQATDEQWYMCIDDADLDPTREYSLGPPASGDPLEQCGSGNFREAEVSIDGQPAGRAPVYPWTYTGGVDPYLWRPTPDVQTLNFVPYQMDLTPFAALLDDGLSHTIAVRVLGAHHYFSLAANLLVYRDHGREVLTGRLTENTLAGSREQLEPHVVRQWKARSNGAGNGQINTIQHEAFVIAGELSTSHGLVATRVEHRSAYLNQQSFLHPDALTYHQIIHMDFKVTDTISTSVADKRSKHVRQLHYPLALDAMKQMKADGTFTAVIGMQQAYEKQLDDSGDGRTLFRSKLDDAIDSQDTADFNAAGTAVFNSRGQHGHQVYRFSDSLGSCYTRSVETNNGTVSSAESGAGCKNAVNSLRWRSWPNAM